MPIITLNGSHIGEASSELIGYAKLRNILLGNGFSTEDVVCLMWFSTLYYDYINPTSDEKYLKAWPQANDLQYKNRAYQLLPEAVRILREKW